MSALPEPDVVPCPHGGHRSSDWRLPAGSGVLEGDVAGQWVCGICHPPPFADEAVERRES